MAIEHSFAILTTVLDALEEELREYISMVAEQSSPDRPDTSAPYSFSLRKVAEIKGAVSEMKMRINQTTERKT